MIGLKTYAAVGGTIMAGCALMGGVEAGRTTYPSRQKTAIFQGVREGMTVGTVVGLTWPLSLPLLTVGYGAFRVSNYIVDRERERGELEE